MFCSKHEEHFMAPKQGCNGPWSKMQQQQQHHHHHHHHHHHFNGLKWDAAPQQQQKHDHCHRSKHSGHGPWWAHQKFAHQPQVEHFHSACPLHQEAPTVKPKWFFRGMPRKENTDTVFDHSENNN